MRLAAAVLGALLLSACSSAAATSGAAGGGPAAEAPAATSRTLAGEAAATAAVVILADDGGLLRPIANGGRIALREGWTTVRFSPVPLGERVRLDVAVFDGSGRAAPGELCVTYESLDMDHGRATEKGVPNHDGYFVPLHFVMPGSWRLVLKITRPGAEDRVTLVLPAVGY